MKIAHVAVLVLFLVAVSFAARLANSGYPTHAANPQRNWKSSRQLGCDVAKGKTVVLRQSWVFDGPDNNFAFSGDRELTIDDQGFMYITGPFPEEPATGRLHINGTFFPTPTYSPSFSDAIPTHVQGAEYYLGGSADSSRVNSNTLTEIGYFIDSTPGEGHSSFVPFGANLMVKTNQGASFGSDAFTYYAIGPNTEFTGTQIQVGSPQLNVIVYNNSGVDIAIAVGDTGDGWMVGSTAWAPVSVDRAVINAFISGNELILICDQNVNDVGAMYRYNPANGNLLGSFFFTLYKGEPFYTNALSSVMYQNGKLFATIFAGESANLFVDLLGGVEYGYSDKYYFSNSRPILSSDNILLLPLASLGEFIELRGYDWESREVKVVGRIPFYYNFDDTGVPVISDNCNVHIAIGNNVHTLAPMRLQNVVPILECVDASGNGYFAYNNLEQLATWVPLTRDRNNLTVVNVAPFEDFAIGRSAYFPLSKKIDLGTTTGTFTWLLEDYTLTFTIGPNLACPTTVTVTVVLTADSPFPPGFNEIVRTTFVNVTGISDNRVTLVNNAKRDVTQTSTLETELAIAPDDTNTEPSPQDVVSNFVSTEVQDQFVAAINSTIEAPSIIGTSLVGKAVDTEQQGVAPTPVAEPVAVPVAAPTNSPTATQPKAAPIAPTSSAAFVNVSIFLAIASFISCL